MLKQNKNSILTGKGFAKVQFLSILDDVKFYLKKDYPIKFLYNKYFNENKFTYSYPHFITLIKRYIGNQYCKNTSLEKKLITYFARIEEDITSCRILKEDLLNALTKENNIIIEFPEVCKILCKALNISQDTPSLRPAVQKQNSPPAEQASASFGKRPAGAKPKI